LVDEITVLATKYSSRSKIKEEAEFPAATFAWQDFMLIANPEISKRQLLSSKKDNPFLRLAVAPDAPRPVPKDHPSGTPLPPRVVGNGMSADELRRRVMGGHTTGYEDVVQRDSQADRTFSSNRDVKEETRVEETRVEEPRVEETPTRFGRYSEAAMPVEAVKSVTMISDYGVRVDQEGWLPSFVLGAPLMVDIDTEREESMTNTEPKKMWGRKKGYVAQGPLSHCDGDVEDKCCMIEMDLGDGRKGNFMIDTASHDVTKRSLVSPKPAPILEGGVSVDGVLDSKFLSQYDLDIDFSRNAAAFFQPGSLLRHNPSIQCGQQIDLPLENSDGPLTVKARLRRDPEPGVFQTEEDFQEIIAVVSTRHSKSLITPSAAAKFKKAPFFNDNLGYDYRIDVGDSVGLSGGSSISNPSSIVAVVEFASEVSKLKTNGGKTLEVMPAAEEAYTLADFMSATGRNVMPDVILGLDILAGPHSQNRVSISWAHERIRICTPSSPTENS